MTDAEPLSDEEELLRTALNLAVKGKCFLPTIDKLRAYCESKGIGQAIDKMPLGQVQRCHRFYKASWQARYPSDENIFSEPPVSLPSNAPPSPSISAHSSHDCIAQGRQAMSISDTDSQAERQRQLNVRLRPPDIENQSSIIVRAIYDEDADCLVDRSVADELGVSAVDGRTRLRWEVMPDATQNASTLPSGTTLFYVLPQPDDNNYPVLVLGKDCQDRLLTEGGTEAHGKDGDAAIEGRRDLGSAAHGPAQVDSDELEMEMVAKLNVKAAKVFVKEKMEKERLKRSGSRSDLRSAKRVRPGPETQQ